MKGLVIFLLAFLANLISFAQTLDYGCELASFGVDADIYSNVSEFGNIATRDLSLDDWFSTSIDLGRGIGVLGTDSLDLWSNAAYLNSNPHIIGQMAFEANTIINGVRLQDGLYARDYYGGSGNIDLTSFISASKNGEDPSIWDHGPHSVTPKNDIIDCYAHLRREGETGEDDLFLFTGFSRISNSGQSYLDVELFANHIAYDPLRGFSTGGPDEGHQAWRFDSQGRIISNGDLVVAVVFNTGSASDVDLRIWISRDDYNNLNPETFRWGSDFDGGSNNSKYGYASIKPRGSMSFGCGLANSESTLAPPWGTRDSNGDLSSHYESNQLLETGINLTRFGIDPALRAVLEGEECWNPFGTILFKSRASASFTAQLKDFSGPYDFEPSPDLVDKIKKDTLKCSQPQLYLRPEVLPVSNGVSYLWETLDGSFLSSTDSVQVLIDEPGTYILHSTLIEGCKTNSDTVYVPRINVNTQISAEIIQDCINKPSLLSSTGEGEIHIWSGPNGFSANGQFIAVDVAGLYILETTVSGINCSGFDSIYVSRVPCEDLQNINTYNIDSSIIRDTSAPVITVPHDTMISCEIDISDVPQSGVVIFDNCLEFTGPATYTDLIISDDMCTGSFRIERTWKAVDACGNIGEAVQVISFQDTTRPSFSVPRDVTLDCASDPNDLSLVGDVIDEWDNCDLGLGQATYTDQVTTTCSGTSRIIRTWMLVDACGNEFTDEQIIILQDNTKPDFTIPDDVNIRCSEDYTDLDLTGRPTEITDNCDLDLPEISFFDVIIDDYPCEGSSVVRRTWTQEDNCGNVVSKEQIISIIDTSGPLFTVPTDVNINSYSIICEFDRDNLSLLGSVVDAVDECGNYPVEVSYKDEEIDEGQCGGISVFKRTWSASDGCGNTFSATQLIRITFFAPPSFTVPEDITILCSDDPDNLALVGDVLNEKDRCNSSIGNATYSDVITPSNDCMSEYVISRTWVLTNDCGISTEAEQTITVIDNVPPTITLSAGDPAKIECDSVLAIPQVGVEIMVSDNCDGDVQVDYFERIIPSGFCTDFYRKRRVWIATDNCNNQDSVVQEYYVQDTENPIILVLPQDEVIECDEPLPSSEIIVNDNCSTQIQVGLTEQIIPGSCDNEYELIRTWTWLDNCGNQESVQQSIKVIDSTPPDFVKPADIIVDCTTDLTDLSLLGRVTGDIDNCDTALPNASYEDVVLVDNSCVGSVTIQRIWSLSDNCGNVTQKTQLISLIDTTAPLFIQPMDITIGCNDDLGDTDITGTVTAITDNCVTSNFEVMYTDDIISDNPCRGSATVIRKWSVVDACGNRSEANQVITIRDTIPPIFQAPEDVVIDCTIDPNDLSITGKAIAEYDQCDSQIGRASFTDVFIVDSLCEGSSIILRNWILSDNCGNFTEEQQVITIRDTIPPVFQTWIRDTVVQCTDIPPAITPTVFDACSNNVTINLQQDTIHGNCKSNYQLLRKWVARDACGNTSEHNQILFVIDTTAPVLNRYPTNITVHCDSLSPPEEITALDGCQGAIPVLYTEFTTAGVCANERVLIRKWSATDYCGNEVIHQQLVTLFDCQPDIIIENKSGENLCANEMLRLNIVTNEFYETSFYQWQFQSLSSGEWIDLINENTSDLYISNVSVADAGSYRCLVADNQSNIYDDHCRNISAPAQIQIAETIDPTYIQKQICPGDQLYFGDRNILSEGIYYDTLRASNACDSVVILELTFISNDVTEIFAEICQGSTYNHNGKELSLPGLYRDTLTTQNLCDSIVILELRVHSTQTLERTIQYCSSNTPFTRDTVIVNNLQSIYGCDSIIISNIDVIPILIDTVRVDVCSGDMYNDKLYMRDTVTVTSSTSSEGCEKLTYSYIDVIEQQYQTLYVSLCNGEKFAVNDSLFSESTKYVIPTLDDYGCEMITTYDIEVLPNNFDTTLVNRCNSYTINGVTYFNDTIVSSTYTSINGCDSISYVQIVIGPLDTIYKTENHCIGETYNGIRLTSDTTIINNEMIDEDCIQVTKIDMIIEQPREEISPVLLCQGDVFMGVRINRDTLIKDLVYEDSICYTVIAYQISVTSSTKTVTNLDFCESGMYLGNIYNRDTILQSITDCDTTIININIFQAPIVEVANLVICSGDSAYIFDGWENMSGTYEHTYKTDGPCDSTAVIILEVEERLDLYIEDATLCKGEEVQLILEGADESLQVDWTPSNTLSCSDCIDPYAYPDHTTTYTVSYPTGCQNEVSDLDVKVEVSGSQEIQFIANEVSMYAGDTTILFISDPDSTHRYIWKVGDKVLCYDCEELMVSPTQSTTYEISTISKSRGCPMAGTLNLVIQPRPCRRGDVHVDNVIFPGSWGYGQSLEVYTTDVEVDVLRIYTRWGELIFETDDIMRRWDGTYKQKALNSGVYVYYIEGRCPDQNTFMYTGNITLVR